MNNKEKTRESSRRWRKENTEKVLKSNREAGKRYIESGKKRNAYYLGKYGITAATADALLAKPCGICGEYTEHMRIDHDHATGAIRGALCHRCNIGLGYFNDGPARLRAALAYLERQAADGIETTIAV